ncbi:hypothetical protein ACTHS2_25035, partial [Streptomyces pseudogriseolus]
WRSGRHQNVKGSGLGLSISRALLAAAERGSPYRPSWPRSRVSAASTSYARSTRTPVASRRG